MPKPAPNHPKSRNNYPLNPHAPTLTRSDMTYWVFGYGSLIWKPPPHWVEKKSGYIRGAVRRFWQSSNDHRGEGTPENPGRVVTLIAKEFWQTLDDPHPYGDDDQVWGVAYRIDPEHEVEVREYLDYREKNGYTDIQIDFVPADGSETFKCTTYVGQPDNEAFVGPQDPDELAKDILRSHGASGQNTEYLFELWIAIKEICPQSTDRHIADLVTRVKNLQTAQA